MKKLLLFIIILISAGHLQAQRKVLVEQFTNSGCPPCAGVTPVIAAYVNQNPSQVLMLAYHTSFPYNDSMYHENAAQSNARVAYYSIGSVPNAKVDGNYYSGMLSSVINTIVPARSAVTPRYTIQFLSSTRNGNNVTVQLLFQSTDVLNQNENLVAHVVLAEKSVQKSAYAASPGNNAETEYPWVVRHMLPDQNGSLLTNKFNGGIDTINLTYTLTNIKDINQLHVIAFVQNNTTKEVYQAEIDSFQTTTAVQMIHAKKPIDLTINPVPASQFTDITLSGETKSGMISLFDLTGNLIREELIQDGKLRISLNGLRDGIYIIQFRSATDKITKRIVINN